ncbi:protein TWIN LOV 1 isoform X2 [Tripterygium wilfordii]|uniref:protein TWIN LOV 1 isoform X2 n=1 Tax=Tripterygium wilfordii TaxID=458696 RepID=UPI0018F831D8|nr:protein TWIN LOV 1 isoform X2 [Tripterygium wilfordii]
MESRSQSQSLLDLIAQSLNGRYSLLARQELDGLPDNFTITDPSICGHPIIYASLGFLKMLGYSKDEVIGKNGRIFQGPKTNRRSVLEIREAIREERTLQINLLNYRKDGTPFWMLFHMSPVFGKEDGRVIHFVAVQVPITGRHKKNGLTLSESGRGFLDNVFGSCRREVCSDTLVELDRVLALDSALHPEARVSGLSWILNLHLTVSEIEELCEANDLEKQRATNSVNNILSVLTRCSEFTGQMVCGKRCTLRGAGLLCSSLNISLGRIKQSFVLINPHLPEMPIVYASDAFLKLTGYDRHEVLERNWRFLNGVDTDSSTLEQIKDSIRTECACTVRILNYRKDSSSFWNLLHISPVRNASGKVAYVVGVQIEEGCKEPRRHDLSPEMRQLSAVGAIKVAVRSLSMGGGSSRS